MIFGTGYGIIKAREKIPGVGRLVDKIAVKNTTAAAGNPARVTSSAKSNGTVFSDVLRNAVGSGEKKSLDTIFSQASEKYNVPEKLLKAVARAESGFQADAVSSCGAQGLMQLMPSTASALGVKNAFDPEQNVMGGAKYLSGLLNKYGDAKLALAAYNAGSGNVAKYGGIPPFAETRNYVEKVMYYAGEDVKLPETAAGSSGTTDSSDSGGFSVSSGIAGSTGSLTDLFGLAGSQFSFDDYRAFLQILTKELEQGALDSATASADEQPEERPVSASL